MRRSHADLASALLLALASCSPQAAVVTGPLPDAAATPDGAATSDAAAAHDAAGGGGTIDAATDGPRCVPGGTTALEPATVACGQTDPVRIGVDETNVYWTVQKSGAIVMKAPLGGGSAEPLVYANEPAGGLAVGVRNIFYTQPSAGLVMRVPKAGGPAVTLAKVDAPLYLAIDLTSDVAALYWTGGTKSNGVIMRLALTADAQPELMLDGQSRPRAIAVRDGFVYWTDLVDGALLRIPASPSPPDGGVHTATRIASGLLGPSDLALTDDFAYMPDQAGRVTRVPLAGGALETVASVHGVPFGIATNGISLYWTTLGSDGGVFRMRLNGNGQVDTLAANEPDPHFLAVGDVAVFWGAWGADAIKKTAR